MPNFANLPKSHRFIKKNCQFVLATCFSVKSLPFSEIPIVSIDKSVYFGLFGKLRAKL